MKEIPKKVHMPGVVVPATVPELGIEAGGLTDCMSPSKQKENKKIESVPIKTNTQLWPPNQTTPKSKQSYGFV